LEAVGIVTGSGDKLGNVAMCRGGMKGWQAGPGPLQDFFYYLIIKFEKL
jgi:hypothetical protein